MLQEERQRSHKLSMECTRLNGMVGALTQDLDQFQQVSQDAQSQAGAAATHTRRQAGQISTLERTVEELRKALDVVEAEKLELRASNRQRRQDSGPAVLQQDVEETVRSIVCWVNA